MTRRRPVPVDHARDRQNWRDLLGQAHRAVAAHPTPPSGDLAQAALKARDFWIAPAPYPCALVSRAFAELVVAYVRQSDLARRGRIGGVVIECAALLDEMLSDERAPDTPMSAITALDRAPARLPYRDADA